MLLVCIILLDPNLLEIFVGEYIHSCFCSGEQGILLHSMVTVVSSIVLNISKE
jgi:hypothetical protein